MKTTSNRILVTPVEAKETKNDLGLTLPDSYELQGLEKAEVLFVGEEIKDLKFGDSLLIYKGAGTKVMEEGKEFRVISVTDIVIIYE